MADVPNASFMAQEGLQAMIEPYLLSNQRLLYSQFIFFTCLMMNLGTTFTTEVELMWKRKQTRLSCLFYFIRYFSPVCLGLGMWGNQSYDIKYWGKTCTYWAWTEGLLCVLVAQTLAEVLMVMRVWALNHFSKRMLALLAFIFIGRTTLAIWAGVKILSTLHVIPWPHDILDIPGCPTTIPSHVYALQISCAYNMVTTGVIATCLLNQCLTFHSPETSLFGIWRDLLGKRTVWSIANILIRDGCVYFFIVFVAELFVLLLISTKYSPLTESAFPIIQAAYSIPATRLVLNLRDRRHGNNPQGGMRPGDLPVDSISLMSFAARRSCELDSFQMETHVNTPSHAVDSGLGKDC